MLIVCPSCASEYIIDPGRLGAEGRTVRCAGCKSTWFVTAEPPAADAPLDDDAADPWNDPADDATGDTAFVGKPGDQDPWTTATVPISGPVEAGSARGSRLSTLAGALLILTIAVAMAAAIWQRAAIVRALPATAALYAGIGLPVNLRGLAFRSVRSELVESGADTFLVVEGEIANISGRDAPVPPIEIGLRAAEGQMLYTWSNEPPRPSLKEGDSMPFRARLAAPPGEARQVLVRFTPSQGGVAAVASQTR